MECHGTEGVALSNPISKGLYARLCSLEGSIDFLDDQHKDHQGFSPERDRTNTAGVLT